MGAGTSARPDGRTGQHFGASLDLVQVDVGVLDRNRRPVKGLRASDFTLFEDGKPRPVAVFAAVDLPARPPTPGAAWMRDVSADVATNDVPQEGRLVVILMDRSIPFGSPAQAARDAARTAIDELATGDMAAVVHSGSSALPRFTSDRARLLAAIGEQPARGVSREASERWTEEKDRLEAEIWNVEDAKRGLAKSLPGDNSGDCYCGTCALDSIQTIADALRETQGRNKSLLFIGADIVLDTTDGRCASAVTDAREAMFRALDLANVTVHSFDANGLESNVVASSSQGADVVAPISPRDGSRDGPPPTLTAARSQQLLTRQGHLGVLPDRTGGRLVLNTNDPEARVPDIFRESGAYYLLGFEPTATDGRLHTISVRVNRPDVRVRARRTYVANATVPASSSPRRLNSSLSALSGPLPARNGIRLTANALAVPAPNAADFVVIVALHAQHEVSTMPAASPAEDVEIVTAVFTADGRPAGVFKQMVNALPPQSPGGAMTYDVLQRLPAKPGHYELRIAVNAAARGQNGSVHAWVDVPAIRKTPFGWSEIGLSTRARPATKDNVAELVPAPPIARRDFDRTEPVLAFISGYHVSGAVPVPLEIVTRVVDDRNRKRSEQRASLSAAFDGTPVAFYELDLPISALEPGAYLLTMEATAGRAKTSRYLRFTVR